MKIPASAVAGGDVTDPGRPVDTRLIIGPNASLSARQALGFFASMCALCLGVAVVLAALGFWPVLPFAGLEMVALGAALAVVLRRNRYREVLEFEGGRLRVQFGMVGVGAMATCEWPRAGTRVWLEHAGAPSAPTQLVLAHGTQRLTIGACLTDAERAALARRLKELLHPAWAAAGAPPAEQSHRTA